MWELVDVVASRRKLVLAVVLGVFALGTSKALLTAPRYQGTAQLLIERADPNVLSFKEVAQTDAARDDYYQTQYKLLHSRHLARRVILDMKLLGDPEFGGPRSPDEIAAMVAVPEGTEPEVERAVDRLLARLRVMPVRNSRLVNVSFEASRPQLAADVANRVAETYIQQALDLRFQTSSEAGRWLSGQIDQQRRKVEELDRSLQELQRREGIVNLDERRTLLDQRLKELGTALNERKTERLQKEALWRQMSRAAVPEELPEVMRSPFVQSLRVELSALERERVRALERFLEQHPEVLRLESQIAETRSKTADEAQRVIRAAENDYKASLAQEGSVAAALETTKQQALELAAGAVNHDSQRRELDAAQQVLNSLLSRAKETDVAQELKTTNMRVVDPSVVPGQPVHPRKLREMALSLLLGLFLAVVLAFVLDFLDNTVKTPEDVLQQLGAPLLGVVPELSPAETKRCLLASHPAAPQPFSEAYRMVRTSLHYSWSEKKPRVVLLTSAGPGEGKTLSSVNLALTLAATGRVLLVDADLRKPAVHHALETPRTPGLSDVLAGQIAPNEAIRAFSPGGLRTLSAGTAVPSPADLLAGDGLRGLLRALRPSFDWIVIDSPPVGAVSEPLVLAPLADGAIVVVGAEMVPRHAAARAIERLAETGARILGVVLNRAQTRKHRYYYSEYYGRYHEGS